MVRAWQYRWVSNAESALPYEMEAPRHPDSYILKELEVERMVKLGCLEGLGWL